jgi:ribosomal protein S18 acetylase RimI-like enzyme
MSKSIIQARLSGYDSTDAGEVTSIWRTSFQRAMGLTSDDFPDDFDQHARYLDENVAIENQMFLMRQVNSNKVIAFMALCDDWINHLYVHVDFQGQGLGSRLLNLAKESSAGLLRLYTFQANKKAQRFYEKHGFSVHALGMADLADNPWATDTSLLADIEYHWHR